MSPIFSPSQMLTPFKELGLLRPNQHCSLSAFQFHSSPNPTRTPPFPLARLTPVCSVLFPLLYWVTNSNFVEAQLCSWWAPSHGLYHRIQALSVPWLGDLANIYTSSAQVGSVGDRTGTWHHMPVVPAEHLSVLCQTLGQMGMTQTQ